MKLINTEQATADLKDSIFYLNSIKANVKLTPELQKLFDNCKGAILNAADELHLNIE